MRSLIQNIMMDGKVHTLNEITEYVQKFMKSAKVDMVKMFMEYQEQYDRKRIGYIAKDGEMIMDIVEKLLASADTPMAEKLL